jgi:hypothetical protein
VDAGSSPPSTASSAPDDPSGHLSVETLRAYRAGLLAGGEAERVRGHLAACADCEELAADVAAFFEADEPGEEETRVDEAASWSRLEGSLAREGWFAARRSRRRLAAIALPLAAALVGLLVLGVAHFVFGYGGEATVLIAMGAYKGGDEEVVSVRLPALLRLVPTAPGGAAGYRAELLDGAGSPVRSYEGLGADRGGRVSLRLHRWELEPGRYRLILRAQHQRPAGSAGEFAFGIKELRK